MEIYFKIYGYDYMLMENYIKPEKYKSFEEAFACCKMNNEYVVKFKDGVQQTKVS